jgi:hypothetical protein
MNNRTQMMMSQNGFSAPSTGGMMGVNNDSLNISNSSNNANSFLSGGNNSSANISSNAVSAFLRNGAGGNLAAMQGMMAGMAGVGNMGGGGGAGGGAATNLGLPNMNNMMSAMSGSSAQNAMMNMNLNLSNLSFDQLKRLQQMAQLQQQASLMPPTTQQDPSTALLQTYLDQKIQTSRFGELSGIGGGIGGLQGMQGQNSMLGAAGTNYLMMNPNNLGGNLNAAGNMSGELPLPSSAALFHRDGSRRMRGGVIEPFPEKLHRLLLEVEAAGRADVISFVAGGRAFAIHKPEKFFKEIVPLYFRQSRLSSFKRQLNLYGFELINTGPARGGYYHELFVKDSPELCRRMRRVAVKVSPKGTDASKISEQESISIKKREVKNKSKRSKDDDETEVAEFDDEKHDDEDPEIADGLGTEEVNSPEIAG